MRPHRPFATAVVALLSLLSLATLACTATPRTTSSGMPAIEPGSQAAAAALLAPGPVVILVRHAEKATDSPTDPTLTDDGQARARALAVALKDAGVTHVITTELRRTKLTAEPLATALGLTPEVVPTRGGVPHVDAMAAAVRRRAPNEVVLVVGHSNTVPAYIAALGGLRPSEICDASYDNLYVLTMGATPRLVRATFGKRTPAC